MGDERVIELREFGREMQTSYCIDLDTRNRQVVEGCRRVKARLKAGVNHEGRIAVVCYGPSLEETWERVRTFDKIITCSGAHKFLIDRGIIPTWHAEVDPRAHKADLIGSPHKDVEYLVASVCHRAVFDLLEGYNVKLWHVYSHETDRKIPMAFPRGEWMLTGGSNVGLRCMVLARFLGFRRMTIFGMDYSFKNDGNQHAGWHPKEPAHVHAVQVGEKFYYTNPAMHQYAQEFFHEIVQLGDIELEVEGDGLLQAQIRERMSNGTLVTTSKPAMIAAVLPHIISPEYLELNKRLHVDNTDYGTSGGKRAATVRKLIEKVKPQSILDYGCGKGLLGLSLPFPIWEFDPAIPGKDAPPRPAELVICTDVLEHVEPDFLEAVIMDLSRCTLRVCYVVINTGPAIKMLADGRNAHLIQQPLEWWKGQLSKAFHVGSITQSGPEVTIILGPKPNEPKPKDEPKQASAVPPLDISQRITPVRHKGTDIRFSTPNDITHWRARSLLTKEPSTVAWIDSMKPGDVLYDVGANVGGYSILAAKHKGVKVFAFEPEAENYALLVRNIALNEVDVKAFCLAICEKGKLDTLHLSARGSGGSGHTFGDTTRNGSHPTQSAIGMSIDELVARGLPQPTHIKIDVDGLEHLVLEGAREILDKVQSVLVEVNPKAHGHKDAVALLQGNGFVFDPRQVEEATRKEGPFKGVAEYIFHRPNPIAEHFQKVIDSAVLVTEPFSYIYIEDALPPKFYEALAKSLDEREWKPISEARPVKGYPERFVAYCECALAGLHELLCAKFGVSGDFTDETLLVRDLPGYKIGPHTDSAKKVITALFYLRGQEGTSIYTPKEKGFTCKGGPHYEFEQFDKVATMPFKPNSMFAFLKSDKSFHGVETTQHQRDVLLFDIRRK